MPDLHFMFDKKWLTVKRDDYQVDVSESQDGSLCMLLLKESETRPFLVMGLPLYVDYYSVHDDQGGFMAFASHKRSAKPSPSWGTVSTRDFGDEKDIEEFTKRRDEEVAKQVEIERKRKEAEAQRKKESENSGDQKSEDSNAMDNEDGMWWTLIISVTSFVLILLLLVGLSAGW